MGARMMARLVFLPLEVETRCTERGTSKWNAVGVGGQLGEQRSCVL